MKQLIPQVNNMMLKETPDQFCEILNSVINSVNELNRKG